MGGSGIPLVPGFQHKGEGGRGEDENRDGCWSQRGGWVLEKGERVGEWAGGSGGVRRGGESKEAGGSKGWIGCSFNIRVD